MSRETRFLILRKLTKSSRLESKRIDEQSRRNTEEREDILTTNCIRAVSFARLLLVMDYGGGYRQRFRFRFLDGVILSRLVRAFPRFRLQHRLDLELFVSDLAFVGDFAFDLLVHTMLLFHQLLQAAQ